MHNTEDFKKLSLKIPDEISSAINDLLIYAAKLETKVALLEYRKYGRSSEKFVNPPLCPFIQAARSKLVMIPSTTLLLLIFAVLLQEVPP